MKSIITLILILVCGAAAFANSSDYSAAFNPQIVSNEQIKFHQMGINMDIGIIVASKYNEVETASETEVARLYKFKNARIKKALAFRTKKNKAKMA